MRFLEVEIGTEPDSKRGAIRNLKGQVVFVEHDGLEPLEGRVISCPDNRIYIIQIPASNILAWVSSSEKSLPYSTLKKVFAVNPEEEFYSRAKRVYREVKRVYREVRKSLGFS